MLPAMELAVALCGSWARRPPPAYCLTARRSKTTQPQGCVQDLACLCSLVTSLHAVEFRSPDTSAPGDGRVRAAAPCIAGTDAVRTSMPDALCSHAVRLTILLLPTLTCLVYSQILQCCTLSNKSLCALAAKC